MAFEDNIPTDPVVSSNIMAAGYDDTKRILRIVFKGKGATYDYSDVEPEVWVGFQEAASKWRFFEANIKYRYQYERIY